MCQQNLLFCVVCVYYTENLPLKLTRSFKQLQNKEAKKGDAKPVYGIIYLKLQLHRRKKNTADKKVQGLHVGELS